MALTCPKRGFTLLELIVATTISVRLNHHGVAISEGDHQTIKRQREKQLRRVLWEMRDAIDRYKDYADRGRLPNQGRWLRLSTYPR